MPERNKNDPKVKEAMEMLQSGVHEIFSSGKYDKYLRTMSKFTKYSARNTVLLHLQNPDVTLVAGYGDWQRKFHRYVRTGEKAMYILAPNPYKRWEYVPMVDSNGQPVLDADGKQRKESQQVNILGFRAVPVFDLSQTDGDPLPALGTDHLVGDVDRYDELMEALRRSIPAPMTFEQIQGAAKGFYSPAEDRIVLREGLEQLQAVKTFIHEGAHSLLHRKGDTLVDDVDSGDSKDSMTREVEAESVAYVVASALGLDTGEYSFGYVAGWSSSKETKELFDSLETIRKTSQFLLERIEDHLQQIESEKLGTELDAISEEISSLMLPADALSASEIRSIIESGDISDLLVRLNSTLVASVGDQTANRIEAVLKRMQVFLPTESTPVETVASQTNHHVAHI